MPHVSTSSIIGLLIVLALAMRQLRHRSVSVDKLWIIPAGAIVAILVMAWNSGPSTALEWAAVAVGIVVGAGIGSVRAHVAITRVDVAERRIHTKGNVLSVLLLAAVMALKILVRSEGTSVLHSTTNVMLALLGTSICGQRFHYYVAYRRAAARAALPA